jgi:hypothetical protein
MGYQGAAPRTSADVDAFVRAAKAAAVPDDALVALLRQSGWSERVVYRSLSAFYGETLGLAVPVRGGAANAREAFYYVLNFITLGFWTIGLGQIFYALIARTFPDTLSRFDVSTTTREVAWQLAAVIVTFPAFLVVDRLIAAELRRRPEAADSPIRSWLTYAALVIAAIVVLLDAIWFLEALIRGELTVRFVLDTIVLLVLGGGVFAYYLSSLQRPAR